MRESTDADRIGESTDERAWIGRRFDVDYYDLVLCAIPLVFAITVLVGTLLSIPPRTSLVASSAIAALALSDALFRNPPRLPSRA